MASCRKQAWVLGDIAEATSKASSVLSPLTTELLSGNMKTHCERVPGGGQENTCKNPPSHKFSALPRSSPGTGDVAMFCSLLVSLTPQQSPPPQQTFILPILCERPIRLRDNAFEAVPLKSVSQSAGSVFSRTASSGHRVNRADGWRLWLTCKPGHVHFQRLDY